MTQPPSLLFLLGSRVVNLVNGEPPYSTLSENTHLFVIAQEALRLGWNVFFKMRGYDECIKIDRLFPVVQYETGCSYDDDTFQPDIMFCVNFPQILSECRHQKPNSMGVLILNAHFWLESPENFELGLVEHWRRGLANDVDFVLTQNSRMADLGYNLFNMIAKWSWRDRFMLAPNTYTPEALHEENSRFSRAEVRQEMELKDDDIAIINSGGPWTWTDHQTFMQAFAKAVHGGATKLRYFQMGLRQPHNEAQKPAENTMRLFMMQNMDLIESGHMVIEEDWQAASKMLPRYNYGADLGLNVSKESTENYQAHRVRFIDYTKANLPVLQTVGAYYGDIPARNAVIPVMSGDIDSYVDALMRINNGQVDLTQKRAAMHEFAESIVSSKVIPESLHKMMQMGRLDNAQREVMRTQLYLLYRSMRENFFDNYFTPQSKETIAAVDKMMERHETYRQVRNMAIEMKKHGYQFPSELPNEPAATKIA